MAMPKIAVFLDRFRIVTLTGDARYLGTMIGGPCGNGGAGAPNTERYAVTLLGVECEGTWDGDARHDITVECPPRELRKAIRAHRRARKLA